MPYQTAPLIGHRRRFIAALQDCIMQIGRMRFARVEREDQALALEVHFHILHSGNPLQHRSQFAHALIAIFPFSRDFDRFQNGIVATLPKKWIGRIGISRSRGVHGVFFVSLSTHGNLVVVAFGSARVPLGSAWHLSKYNRYRSWRSARCLRENARSVGYPKCRLSNVTMSKGLSPSDKLVNPTRSANTAYDSEFREKCPARIREASRTSYLI